MPSLTPTIEATNWSAACNDFKRDGYIVLRSFLDREELLTFEENLQRLIVEVVPTMPSAHVYYEDKDCSDTLKQLQALHTYNAYFAQQFLSGKFQRLADELFEEPAIGKNMQFFNKPPGKNQATPPHQDGYYMQLVPCKALTMWLALDNVDEENGCVRYVQGSHRLGMRPHARTQVLGFSQGITDYPSPNDIAQEVALPARPGDLLVHDALMIHRADGNRSANRTRRALGFIYYAESAKEDLEAKQAYQARLDADLQAAGKI